jgi:prepilin-type N-terminal cleavage/methylation domain-containing protein/prepilin-type processing-associated H-X9-DG protein
MTTNRRQERRLGPEGALTLIELLVVLVVVAILASLLLPTLTQAKARTRATLCLSQVKQWAYAMHMYCDDAEDFFPYEGSPMEAIHVGDNRAAWYNAVAPYANQVPLKDLYAQRDPPLPGARSLYLCPSVRDQPGTATVSRPYFAYGFNNRLDPDGPEQFRRGQVVSPAETVVFTENSENQYPSASGRFTPGRHVLRANLGFCDGHAQAVATNDYRRTTAEDQDSRIEWRVPRAVYWYPFSGAPR